MKIWVCIISVLLMPVLCFAGPFVVSDSYVAPAIIPDRFKVTLDTGAEQALTPWTGGGLTNVVHFDLAGIATGAHVVNVKACKGDPLWGQEVCSTASVLNFTKPTPPAAAPLAPVGLLISQ